MEHFINSVSSLNCREVYKGKKHDFCEFQMKESFKVHVLCQNN